MNYEKEIKKEIEKFQNFYQEVSKRAESSKNLVDRAYRHEARTIIGRLQNAEDLKQLGEEGKEFSQELLKKTLENEIPHLRDLENLVKIGDLKKEEILKGESNFYEIMQRQQNIHKDYMNSQNISYNTFGDSTPTNFNSSVASALISTTYGNAVKWAPKNTEINQSLKDKNNKTIIRMENEFGDSPENPNIGENKGIGSLFTNTILERIKGSIEYYGEPRLSKTKNPIYGVKLILPKK